MLKCCVLVGLDWAEPMIFLLLHITCSWIFHAYVSSFIFILILILLVLFWLFFSLPLSLFLMLVASWHINKNSFRLGTLFTSGHLLLLLLLTPLLLTYGSVMRRTNQNSRKTFHDVAFIRNVKSFYQTFLILTYPLSSTVGVGSHFMASQSRALPWSYRSSTTICMDLIILYPNLSLAFGVYTW